MRDSEEWLLLKVVRPGEGKQESTSHQEESRGRHGLLLSGLNEVSKSLDIKSQKQKWHQNTPSEVTLRLCQQDSGKEGIWPITI